MVNSMYVAGHCSRWIFLWGLIFLNVYAMVRPQLQVSVCTSIRVSVDHVDRYVLSRGTLELLLHTIT
jgi:hypothetical protein